MDRSLNIKGLAIKPMNSRQNAFENYLNQNLSQFKIRGKIQ